MTPTLAATRPRRRANNMLNRRLAVLLLVLSAMLSAIVVAQNAPATSQKAKRSAARTKSAAMAGNMIALPSPSPLYQIQIMVRAGSANDPAGKEGTASLLGDALIEGGFGS